MSLPLPPSDLFRARLAPELAARILGEGDHVADVLAALVESAQRAHPTVSVPVETFVVYLAERLPAESTSIDTLRELRLDDLYLACGCAEGDPAALALFDAGHIAGLGSVVPRLSGVTVSEVQQAVRERLLLAHDGDRPKIAGYSGRADLSSWVRVVAVRTALNLARGANREVALDEDDLLASAAESDDAEIRHLKTLYRGEFREAFQHALASLSVRDRNMLRQHYVDGLAMDQLGAMYQVHRITIVRRMKEVRHQLADDTRRTLKAKLRVSRGELDSIMRLIQSNLDVSLRVYLRPDGK